MQIAPAHAGPRLPVAALSSAPGPSTSGRYAFTSSLDVVQLMANEGYEVAATQTTHPRRLSAEFAKHMIDFRRPDLAPVDGVVPRILFVNSHDGSSAAHLTAGAFRFVCSNGLVFGKANGTELVRERVRHTGDAAADLISRVRQLAKETTNTYQTIERWSKKELTPGQVRDFARMAAVIRWGNAEFFQPDEILAVRRAEDDSRSLWATFNRVQENLTRGGLVGLSASGRAATSRPLTDIARGIRFNETLWALAEEISA